MYKLLILLAKCVITLLGEPNVFAQANVNDCETLFKIKESLQFVNYLGTKTSRFLNLIIQRFQYFKILFTS